jgi:hypothetical protein
MTHVRIIPSEKRSVFLWNDKSLFSFAGSPGSLCDTQHQAAFSAASFWQGSPMILVGYVRVSNRTGHKAWCRRETRCPPLRRINIPEVFGE